MLRACLVGLWVDNCRCDSGSSDSESSCEGIITHKDWAVFFASLLGMVFQLSFERP